MPSPLPKIPPKQRRSTPARINVDDLFALIESVRRDPAKGVTHWHVATTWQGQTHSRSQVEGFGIGGEEVTRRFSMDIDEPLELGGSRRR